MTRKAGSLTFPKNALAAMQELSALDAPAPTSEEAESPQGKTGSHVTALPESNTVTLPEINMAALPPINSVTLPVEEASMVRETLEPEMPDGAKPRKAAPKPAKQHGSPVAQTTSSAVGSATGSDPVRQAMLGMLAQPYPDDMAEGAMTVTSVKIPKPIWERLDYARTITKKDKQDIIAEALRLYFDQIVRGQEK